MMRFAWGVKIATNCNTTVMHLDKIFISRFVSLAAAGSYQIGSTLAVAMREFMRLSVSALLPAVAAMAARGDMARLRQVNRQASRVFVAVATPLFFFIAATAPLVIQAWLGAPGADSATALRLLSLAFYVNVAMAASMEIGAALHLSSLQMWTALGASLLNVVLNYFFVLRFGFVGPPIASILTLGLGSLVYMARLLRRLGEDTGAFFVHVALRPVLVGGAIALAMTWWTERHGVTLADGAPRATVLALLGGALAAGSVLYAVVLPVTGHLRPDDRRLIRRILGGQKGVAPTRPSDLPEE
jgi:O-antigen/teichoic acid export membrane protein